MTSSYVRHDSYICAQWLMHMYVGHDSYIRGPWLIHAWAMTHTFVGHDSFSMVSIVNHMCLRFPVRDQHCDPLQHMLQHTLHHTATHQMAISCTAIHCKTHCHTHYTTLQHTLISTQSRDLDSSCIWTNRPCNKGIRLLFWSNKSNHHHK